MPLGPQGMPSSNGSHMTPATPQLEALEGHVEHFQVRTLAGYTHTTCNCRSS